MGHKRVWTPVVLGVVLALCFIPLTVADHTYSHPPFYAACAVVNEQFANAEQQFNRLILNAFNNNVGSTSYKTHIQGVYNLSNVIPLCTTEIYNELMQGYCGDTTTPDQVAEFSARSFYANGSAEDKQIIFAQESCTQWLQSNPQTYTYPHSCILYQKNNPNDLPNVAGTAPLRGAGYLKREFSQATSIQDLENFCTPQEEQDMIEDYCAQDSGENLYLYRVSYWQDTGQIKAQGFPVDYVGGHKCSEVSTQDGYDGACVLVRSAHGSYPNAQDSDVGPTYAKRHIPGPRTFEHLKDQCTLNISFELLQEYCDAGYDATDLYYNAQLFTTQGTLGAASPIDSPYVPMDCSLLDDLPTPPPRGDYDGACVIFDYDDGTPWATDTDVGANYVKRHITGMNTHEQLRQVCTPQVGIDMMRDYCQAGGTRSDLVLYTVIYQETGAGTLPSPVDTYLQPMNCGLTTEIPSVDGACAVFLGTQGANSVMQSTPLVTPTHAKKIIQDNNDIDQLKTVCDQTTLNELLDTYCEANDPNSHEVMYYRAYSYYLDGRVYKSEQPNNIVGSSFSCATKDDPPAISGSCIVSAQGSPGLPHYFDPSTTPNYHRVLIPQANDNLALEPYCTDQFEQVAWDYCSQPEVANTTRLLYQAVPYGQTGRVAGSLCIHGALQQACRTTVDYTCGDIDYPQQSQSSGAPTHQRLTQTPLQERNPHIHGSRVVYSEQDGNNVRFLYHDRTTGQTQEIATSTGGASIHEINHLYAITFPDSFVDPDLGFRYYEFSTETVDQVVRKGMGVPSLGNQFVVFSDMREDSNGICFFPSSDTDCNQDIWLHNLQTGQDTRITSTPTTRKGTAVTNGEIVVYTQGLGANKELRLFTLSTGQEQLIASGNLANPRIEGTHLVWVDYRHGHPTTYSDLYHYDLESGQTTRVTPSTQYHMYDWAVDAQTVYWSSAAGASTYEYSISSTDLTTGQTEVILQGPYDSLTFDVNQGTLVIDKSTNNEQDITLHFLGGSTDSGSCGNGVCESFESVESCFVDCASAGDCQSCDGICSIYASQGGSGASIIQEEEPIDLVVPKLISTAPGAELGYLVELVDKPIMKVKAEQEEEKRRLEFDIRRSTKRIQDINQSDSFGFVKTIQRFAENNEREDLKEELDDEQERSDQAVDEYKEHQRKNRAEIKHAVADIIGKAPEQISEYEAVFNGFFVHASLEQVHQIRALEGVKQVHENKQVNGSLYDSVELTQTHFVREYGYSGTGVSIAIIDSGIDYTHEDFGSCTHVSQGAENPIFDSPPVQTAGYTQLSSTIGYDALQVAKDYLVFYDAYDHNLHIYNHHNGQLSNPPDHPDHCYNEQHEPVVCEQGYHTRTIRRDMDIDGDRIIYEDQTDRCFTDPGVQAWCQNVNYKFYLYDISDQTNTELLEVDTQLGIPKIAGDYALYHFSTSEDLAQGLWVQDISTKQLTHITENADGYYGYDGAGYPFDIAQEKVVFSYEGTIYLYDIVTDQTRSLSISNVNSLTPIPSFDGEYVIYNTREYTDDWYVELYKISTGQTKRISEHPYPRAQHTDIFQGRVLYKERINDQEELHVYDIDTDTTEQVSLPINGLQRQKIAGNKVFTGRYDQPTDTNYLGISTLASFSCGDYYCAHDESVYNCPFDCQSTSSGSAGGGVIEQQGLPIVPSSAKPYPNSRGASLITGNTIKPSDKGNRQQLSLGINAEQPIIAVDPKTNTFYGLDNQNLFAGAGHVSVPGGEFSINPDRFAEIGYGPRSYWYARDADTDFDGNGKPELVTRYYSDDLARESEIVFYEFDDQALASNPMREVFSMRINTSREYSSFMPLDTGDVDQDGKKEILVYGHDGVQMFLRLYESPTVNGYPTELVWEQQPFHTINGVIDDTDGDGRMEIISAGEFFYNDHINEQGIIIYEHTADNTFEQVFYQSIPNMFGGQKLNVLNDVDGDGRKELAFTGFVWQQDGTHRVETYVFENTGDNQYQQIWSEYLGTQDSDINGNIVFETGDMDNDGKKEFVVGGFKPLVIGGSPGSFMLRMFEAESNNNFQPVNDFEIMSLTTLGGSRAATIADVDNDQVPELVMTSEFMFIVFKTTSDNTFDHYWITDRIELPDTIIAHDFNANDKPEIFVDRNILNSIILEYDKEPYPPSHCSNRICEHDETEESCPLDCADLNYTCGNNVCELGEFDYNCPQDCEEGHSCGNNVCDELETQFSCPFDCKANTLLLLPDGEGGRSWWDTQQRFTPVNCDPNAAWECVNDLDPDVNTYLDGDRTDILERLSFGYDNQLQTEVITGIEIEYYAKKADDQSRSCWNAQYSIGGTRYNHQATTCAPVEWNWVSSPLLRGNWRSSDLAKFEGGMAVRSRENHDGGGQVANMVARVHYIENKHWDVCGNNVCGFGENRETCPQDCGGKLPGTFYRVTRQEIVQNDPALNDDYVIWTDHRKTSDLTSPHLFGLDLHTGLQFQATYGKKSYCTDPDNQDKDVDCPDGMNFDSSGQHHPFLEGDNLFYSDSANWCWSESAGDGMPCSDIYVINLKTNNTQLVARQSATQSNPHASGNRVTWFSFRAYGNFSVVTQVWWKDIGTGEMEFVANGFRPKMLGDYVVYSPDQTNQTQIALYNVLTKSTSYVDTGVLHPRFDVSDEFVVHDVAGAPGIQVKLWDIVTQYTEIIQGEFTEESREPHLSSDLVVYNQGEDWAVQDLDTNQTSLISLPGATKDHLVIHKDLVAFDTNLHGRKDVYLYSPTGFSCGDGLCLRYNNESTATCPQDCSGPDVSICGNLVCESDEHVRSCPLDCPPSLEPLRLATSAQKVSADNRYVTWEDVSTPGDIGVRLLDTDTGRISTPVQNTEQYCTTPESQGAQPIDCLYPDPKASYQKNPSADGSRLVWVDYAHFCVDGNTQYPCPDLYYKVHDNRVRELKVSGTAIHDPIRTSSGTVWWENHTESEKPEVWTTGFRENLFVGYGYRPVMDGPFIAYESYNDGQGHEIIRQNPDTKEIRTRIATNGYNNHLNSFSRYLLYQDYIPGEGWYVYLYNSIDELNRRILGPLPTQPKPYGYNEKVMYEANIDGDPELVQYDIQTLDQTIISHPLHADRDPVYEWNRVWWATDQKELFVYGQGGMGCGDSMCLLDETHASCPQDCDQIIPVCGDGFCDGGETTLTCSQDCGGAPSDQDSSFEFELTSQSIGQGRSPQLVGDTLVWSDDKDTQGSRMEVYRYDLNTKKEHRVTYKESDLRYLASSSDKIVYSEHIGVQSEIYVVDIATNQTTSLGQGSDTNSNMDIDGDLVVWQKRRGDDPYTVHYHNLRTGQTGPVSTSTASMADPSISGTKVVWEDQRDRLYSNDIYLKDLETGDEQRITQTTDSEKYPQIHDSHVVWQLNAQIYLYNTQSQQTTQLTTSSSYKSRPSVHGDFVAWADHDNFVGVYHIPSGQTTNIPNEYSIYGTPIVYENKVVYADADGTIHVTSLTGASVDTPTPQEYTIINGNSQKHSVRISDHSIVWVDLKDLFTTGADIYAYDRTTEQTRKIGQEHEASCYDLRTGEEVLPCIENVQQTQTWPELDGHMLVYVDSSDYCYLTDTAGGYCSIAHVHNLETGEDYLLEPDSKNIIRPRISGDYVVYGMGQWGDAPQGMFIKHLQTGEKTQIDMHGSGHYDISGNYVVYNRYNTVYIYDIAQGVETSFDAGYAYPSPFTDGEYVSYHVWTGTSGQIMLYHIPTGEISQASEYTHWDPSPPYSRMSEGKVGYLERYNDQTRVKVYDIHADTHHVVDIPDSVSQLAFQLEFEFDIDGGSIATIVETSNNKEEIGLTILNVSPPPAPDVSQTIRVTTHPSVQSQAAISAKGIVWTDQRNIPSYGGTTYTDIFALNFNDGTVQKINEEYERKCYDQSQQETTCPSGQYPPSNGQSYPDIDGAIAVWQDPSDLCRFALDWGSCSTIYYYNMDTKQVSALDPGFKDASIPKISGDYIAFTHSQYGSESPGLYVQNWKTGQQSFIATGSSNHQIGGDYVVYQYGGTGFYLYQISTQQLTTIQTGSGFANPDTDGTNIAYNKYDQGQWHIYLYPIATQSEQKISVQGSDHDTSVRIADGKVTYMRRLGSDFDLMQYDIATGATTDITQITEFPYGFGSYEQYVALHYPTAGNQDIHLYSSTGFSCGDGICMLGETEQTCAQDCTQEQAPLPPSNSCRVHGGWDFVNNDGDPMDDHGHGTHIAGIAASSGPLQGMAPDAELYAYKVLDQSNFGSWADIVAGVERSMDPNQDGDYSDHLDIVSISIVGSGNPDDVIASAVDTVVDNGVVAVVCAGNSGPGAQTITTPGGARKAITVGASTKGDAIASYSSRGPVIWGGQVMEKPDLLAPGSSICGSKASVRSGVLCFDSEHIRMSGCSMATPHVSGAVALLLEQNPDLTPLEIKTILKNTADDLGYDVYTQGAGRLNTLRALGLNTTPLLADLDIVQTIQLPFNITGTAAGVQFDRYVVEYGEGDNPTSWTTLTQSSTAVANGVLATIDNPDFASGTYTIRLSVYDSEDAIATDLFYTSFASGWPIYLDAAQGAQNPGFNKILIDDIDGDGDQEIYAAASTQATNLRNNLLYLFDHEGSIYPGWPKQFPDTGIRDIVIVDFFGDGTKELVYAQDVPVVFGQDTKARIHVVDHLGNDIPGWDVEYLYKNNYEKPLLAADVDGDQAQELIVTDLDIAYTPFPQTTSMTIKAYDGTGSLKSGWPVSYETESARALMATGDVQGSTAQELIIAIPSGQFSGSQPSIDIIQGDGTLVNSLSFEAAHLEIKNMDDQGKEEIVLFTTQPGEGAHLLVDLYALDAQGTTLPHYPVSIPNVRSWTNFYIDYDKADVTGDGIDEHILSYPTLDYLTYPQDIVMVLDTQGNQVSGWPVQDNPQTGYRYMNSLADDITGDGIAEILIRDDQRDTTYAPSHYIQIRTGYATSMLTQESLPMSDLGYTEHKHPLLTADLEGDETKDIIVQVKTPTGTALITIDPEDILDPSVPILQSTTGYYFVPISNNDCTLTYTLNATPLSTLLQVSDQPYACTDTWARNITSSTTEQRSIQLTGLNKGSYALQLIGDDLGILQTSIVCNEDAQDPTLQMQAPPTLSAQHVLLSAQVSDSQSLDYCEVCISTDGVCDTEWTTDGVVETFSSGDEQGSCSALVSEDTFANTQLTVALRVHDQSAKTTESSLYPTYIDTLDPTIGQLIVPTIIEADTTFSYSVQLSDTKGLAYASVLVNGVSLAQQSYLPGTLTVTESGDIISPSDYGPLNVTLVVVDNAGNNHTKQHSLLVEEPIRWSGDLSLGEDGQSSSNPHLFVDSNGARHVVWEDLRDDNPEIYYSKIEENGQFPLFEQRVSNNLYNSKQPQIATSGSLAAIVWIDDREGNLEVYLSTYENDQLAISEKRLTANTFSTDQPVVFVKGQIITVFFRDDRTGTPTIYAKQYDAQGVLVTSSIQLSTSGITSYDVVSTPFGYSVIFTSLLNQAYHLSLTDTLQSNVPVLLAENVISAQLSSNTTFAVHHQNGSLLVQRIDQALGTIASHESIAHYTLLEENNEIHTVWTSSGNSTEVYYEKKRADASVLISKRSITDQVHDISTLTASLGSVSLLFDSTTSGVQELALKTTVTDDAAPTLNFESPQGQTEFSARATWTTTEPTFTLFRYGTSTTLDQSITRSTLGYDHQITLSDLLPETTYYAQVQSTDIMGNTITSPLRTFTTQTLSARPELPTTFYGQVVYANGSAAPFIEVTASWQDASGNNRTTTTTSLTQTQAAELGDTSLEGYYVFNQGKIQAKTGTSIVMSASGMVSLAPTISANPGASTAQVPGAPLMIDISPPQIIISSPQDASYTALSQQLVYISDDELQQAFFTLNDGQPVTITSLQGQSIPLTAQLGQNVLSIVATNVVGLTSTETVIFTITDTTAPTLNISSLGLINGIVEVQGFIQDEANTLAPSCEVCISDDGLCDTEWQSASTTYGAGEESGYCVYNWDTSLADDGAYLIQLRGSDNANNVGYSPLATATVDNTAPGELSVSATSSEERAEITVTWDVSSTDDFFEYRLYRSTSTFDSLDQAELIFSTSDQSQNAYLDTSLEEQTTYYYAVIATDTLANLATFEVESATTADFTPPQLVITSPQNTLYLTTTVELTYTVQEQVENCVYTLNSQSSPLTQGITLSPTEGINALTISCDDQAGNTGTSAPVVFEINAQPPPVTTDVSASRTDQTTVSLSWSPSTASDFAHYKVYRSLTDFTTTNQATLVGQSPAPSLTDTIQTDGITYYYGVSAVDTAGHEQQNVATTSITLADQTPPGIISGMTAMPAPDANEIALSWDQITDNAFDRYNVYKSSVPISSLDQASLLISITQVSLTTFTDTLVDSEQEYYYGVRAQDESGNEQSSAVIVRAVASDTIAPTITLSGINPLQTYQTVPYVIDMNEQLSSCTLTVGSEEFFITVLGTECTDQETSCFPLNGVVPAQSGTHTVQATCVDQGGNSATSNELTITVDSTPPTVIEDLQVETEGTQVTLSWSSVEPQAQYAVYRSTSPFTSSAGVPLLIDTASTSIVDTTAQTDTTYYYGVSATDSIGNTQTQIQTVSVQTPDTQAPTIVIASPVEGSYDYTDHTLLFSTSESATCTLSTNGQQSQSINSNTPLSADQGFTTYQLSCTDSAGNTAVNSVTLFVDTIAPTPVAITSIEQQSGQKQVDLIWQQSTDSNFSHYVVYRTSSPLAPVQSIFDSSQTSYQDTTVEEGETYNYTVTTVDLVGNEDTAVPIVSITIVDVTPPQITFIEPPQIPKADPQTTVSISVNEPSTCTYTVNQGSLTPIETSDEFSASEGENLIDVFCTDAAGNSAQASRSFTLDTTPPNTISNVQATAIEGTTTVQVSWDENQESDLETYNVYLSTNSFTEPQENLQVRQTTENQVLLDGLLDETTYYVAITGVDSLGNEPSSVTPISVRTADLSAPDPIQGLLINTVVGQAQLQLSWTPSNAQDLSHYEIYRSTSSFSGPLSFLKIANTTSSSYTDSDLASETTYYYGVVAVDTSDNKQDTLTAVSATTPDTTPPIVTITSPDNTLYATSSIIVDFTTSESVSGCTYTLNSQSSQSLSSGSGITGAEGNNSLVVSCTDTAGNLGVSDTQYFSIDTTAPQPITGLRADVLDAPTRVNLSWSPSPAQDLASYRVYRSSTSFTDVSTLTPYSTVFSSNFMDTNVDSDTTYYYAVVGVDALGHVDTSVVSVGVTVQDYIPPVIIISSPIANTYLDPSLTLVFSVNEPINYCTYTLSGHNPVNVTTQDAVGFSAVEGQSTITVDCVDLGSNSGSASVTFSVDTQAPLLIQGLNVNAVAGQNRLDLTWLNSPSTDIGGYGIYRHDQPFGEVTEATRIGTSTSVEFSDTAVSSGETWHYAVTGIDIHGHENTSVISVNATVADTLPPSMVENVAVTRVGDSALHVTWDSVPDADLSHYSVYRSLDAFDNSSQATLRETTLINNSYTDTLIEESTRYYFGISATDTSSNEQQSVTSVLGITSDLTKPLISVTQVGDKVTGTIQLSALVVDSGSGLETNCEICVTDQESCTSWQVTTMNYSASDTVGTCTYTWDTASALRTEYRYAFRTQDVDANNASSEEFITLVVDSQGLFDHQIQLKSGWNLISLPLTPIDNTTGSILSTLGSNYDRVYYYQRGLERWISYGPGESVFEQENELNSLYQGQGYWIRVPSDITYTLSGTKSLNTSIDLQQGWNYIGYPYDTPMDISAATSSIQDHLVKMYSYDSTQAKWDVYRPQDSSVEPNTITQLEPGKGYIVYVQSPVLWQP